MSLDELTKQANAGDVEAMLELSRYYQNLNSFEGMEKSLVWSEKAAEAGDPNGVVWTAYKYPVLAMINESQSVGDYQTAAFQWGKAKKWASQSIEQVELDDEIKKEIDDIIDNAEYGIGAAYYYQKDYVAVLNTLSGKNDIRSSILRGCALFAIASGEQELTQAYNALRVIENAGTYYNTVNSGPDYEQRLFIRANRFLSSFYRIGIRGYVEVDLDHAVLVLTNAQRAINNADLKSQIQNDLGHYKKKLLGGYKYI